MISIRESHIAAAPAFVCILLLAGALRPSPGQDWQDISSGKNISMQPSGQYGTTGAVVNRLTGDLFVSVNNAGLWKSSDQGTTFSQVVGADILSGRAQCAGAINIDQHNPERMALFLLDGNSGWTVDGEGWRKFGDRGRGWDYGSPNWSVDNPQTIIAARHEYNSEVCVSRDGGKTWNVVSVQWPDGSKETSGMLLAVDATILLCGNLEGIFRSTDTGESWTKVSSEVALTRNPLIHDGVIYVGTRTGMIISEDQGQSWTKRGEEIVIWQGPMLGRNDNEMLVVGEAVYASNDRGAHWKKVADLPAKSICGWPGCTSRMFVGYAWDPRNSLLYFARMEKPVYRAEITQLPLSTTSATPCYNTRLPLIPAHGEFERYSLSGRRMRSVSPLPCAGWSGFPTAQVSVIAAQGTGRGVKVVVQTESVR